jgi:amino acid adenylation domain-containing protein
MSEEIPASQARQLQERLKKLSPEQRAALEKLMQQKGINTTRLDASQQDIPLQARGGTFPLSFGQQRMWFVDQFGAGLKIHGIFRIQGDLHFDALQSALDKIIERHEVLRTTYHRDPEGRTYQQIEPHSAFELLLIDLRQLPADAAEIEVARLEQEQVRDPYDLGKAPLLRAAVFTLATDECVFMVNVAHIAFDGWSWGVFIRELGELYDAYVSDQAPALKPLALQYLDYAVWERDWLSGAVLQKQLDFWKQQLSDIPILELPTDSGQASEQGAPGLVHRWSVDKDLAKALRELNKKHDATMFMTLLAAFAVMLKRYSGQEDIVIGCPVANRSRPELEDLIGCFMNPLPFRIDLSGNPSFSELLKRVRDLALQVFAHQNTPFDLLVKTFHPLRDVRTPPLFQVMFLLQNISEEPPPLGDLKIRPFRARSGRTDEADHLLYQIALQVSDPGTGLLGQLEYANEYRSYLARAPQHFQALLQSLVENPDTPIGQLGMLAADEYKQILEHWACERTDFASRICAHQLFEAQAHANKDTIAVVLADQALTYDELNRRANRLAHLLIDRGVQAETIVGIMLDRSLDMVVAALAVMKSGGAYVPLDPDYPAERLAFIMADTRMPLLLTRKTLLSDIALASSIEIVDIDSPVTNADENNPVIAIKPSSLAYVIHTSGSTGKPKGTMISHASLANAYHAWEKSYGLGNLVHAHLQMASMSFDVFSGDLVRALCSGGKLVIVPRDMLLEPQRLYSLMQQEKVDCAEFVPVVFRGLSAYLGEKGLSLDFMKLVILGSDAWNVGEYRAARALCGEQTRLINSYGVTEATIDSTFFEGDVDGLSDGAQVPIGRPFANTEVYILDKQMQPVPVGVPGELWLGGPGLARGYLNRDDLSAERFVKHPFSQQPGERLYRSGDLARFMADGNIELMGRADFQVKVRGFRVETGEIESLLISRDDVKECVVVLREDRPGEKRLVAYCVAAGSQELSPTELRKTVASTLPDYMVPSAFVQLDRLPTTPNRKIDRKALPAPDGERQLEDVYVAPGNSTEQKITAVWQEVLGLDKIGIHDNFFDLGGHSLLIVQAQKKLCDIFEQDIPIVQLFEHPTISTLARQLGQEQETRPEQEKINTRAQKQKSAIERQKAMQQRHKRIRSKERGSSNE